MLAAKAFCRVFCRGLLPGPGVRASTVLPPTSAAAVMAAGPGRGVSGSPSTAARAFERGQLVSASTVHRRGSKGLRPRRLLWGSPSSAARAFERGQLVSDSIVHRRHRQGLRPGPLVSGSLSTAASSQSLRPIPSSLRPFEGLERWRIVIRARRFLSQRRRPGWCPFRLVVQRGAGGVRASRR